MAEYEYDIAISFADEDRNIAEEIAIKLKKNAISVFYDKYEEANLFGEDLYERLHEVYSARARFCIMIISQPYAENVWKTHERKSAQERALREKGAYILPVRLDDTRVPGLNETIAYYDLREKTINQLIKIVIQKLKKTSKISSQTHIVDRDKEISTENENAVNVFVSGPIDYEKLINFLKANSEYSEDFIRSFFKQDKIYHIQSIYQKLFLFEAFKNSLLNKSLDEVLKNYDKIIVGNNMLSNEEKLKYKILNAVTFVNDLEFDDAHKLLEEVLNKISPIDKSYSVVYKQFLITGFICYARRNDIRGLKSLLRQKSKIGTEKNEETDYIVSMIFQEIFSRDTDITGLHEVVSKLGDIYLNASNPIKSAMANSLGLAYRRLGERTGVGNLEKAITIFKEGIELNKEEKNEIELKDQMAIAHIRMFEFNKNEDQLKIAETLLNDCLKNLEGPMDPRDYRLKPRILNNIGNIYKQRTLALNDFKSAAKAIVYYEEAAKYWNESDASYDWALVRKNIAETKYALGKLTNDFEILLEALSDCIRAIKYRNLKNSPYQWGKTVKIIFSLILLFKELNLIKKVPKSARKKILSYTLIVIEDETKWMENLSTNFVQNARQVQKVLL